MVKETKLVIETIHGPEKPSLNLEGENQLTIGRGEDNDLSLVLGKTVSRQHAVLIRSDSQDGESWKLFDSDSRHGTFLNGIKINKDRGVRLRIGDLITIEPFTFQVVDQNEEKKYAIRLMMRRQLLARRF